MLPFDLVPSKDDKRVLSFCESICPGQRPFYVPMIPDDDAQPLQCFPNVEARVARDGGALVYGWELTWNPKIYLEAQFHAVWKSRDGHFRDVTPPALPAPLAELYSRLLFLPDARRTYTGQKIQPHRLALGSKSLVERFWTLTDMLMEIDQQTVLAGLSQDVYVQRTAEIRAERLSIQERLQNAP
jgi:hypothetical protein